MGNRPTIELQAVAVEAPSESRITYKRLWLRDVLEGEAASGERRVRTPKSILPSKVGQAGVNAHSGPGSNNQCIRLQDDFCGAFYFIGIGCTRAKAPLHGSR